MTITTETVKQQYFRKIAKKLSDSNISSKTYWPILKCFLTGKRVPCIPPIFHENRFITNFREKPELLNSFFVNQCSLIRKNDTFTENDIGRLINSLDPNKAHGHEMMDICMLKIGGDSLNKTLGLI